MRDKLRDWQSALKAPERTFVTLVDVVPPSTPAPNRARATKLGLLAFMFGLGLSLGIAYLRHRTRDRRRARAVTQPVAAGQPRSGFRPVRRLGWRPPFPGRAANEGDAGPVLVPPAPKRTEPARVPMTLPKIEPDPVPKSPKKKTEPAPVPTSQREKTEPAPVPTSQRKRTEPALIRRSMKKKAELAVVPPTRPARPAVRRPATPPHDPGPSVDKNSQRVLVPVPVKRNGRSRNP